MNSRITLTESEYEEMIDLIVKENSLLELQRSDSTIIRINNLRELAQISNKSIDEIMNDIRQKIEGSSNRDYSFFFKNNSKFDISDINRIINDKTESIWILEQDPQYGTHGAKKSYYEGLSLLKDRLQLNVNQK